MSTPVKVECGDPRHPRPAVSANGPAVGTSAVRAAMYARVSSERQREEATIDSQLEAVRQRMAEDGVAFCEELCFVDNGYSGGTLSRPAMEKLRDAVAFGRVDVVYVHAPPPAPGGQAHTALFLPSAADAR